MQIVQRGTVRLLAVAAMLLTITAGERHTGITSAAMTTYDWLQFNGDAQHSGNNTQESVISATNVSSLQQVFQVSLPDVADGAPAFLSGVLVNGSPTDLLFLTTRDGHILAVNARSGATLWSKQYGPGACTINNGGSPCYTTSSPAIDPNRQYVYSYGLDGKVHKYQVADGTEVTGNGWPETVTLKGFDEKGSADLSIATDHAGASYLYVANGGYPGDNGDYQGHITTINLTDGSQTVFNTMCSDQTVHFVEQPGTPDCPDVQSAVWARAGVVYDPTTDKIYLATGNGTFDPASHYWGDSVLSLNPDGTGANGDPLGTYTPVEFQQLQNGDLDLGSTAPALLPAPGGSAVAHLALQSGKDSKLRLLDLDQLDGTHQVGLTGGELQIINVPQGNEVLTAPAVWVDGSGTTWVFVANDNGIAGLQLNLGANNIPTLSVQWQNTASGCSSPLIVNHNNTPQDHKAVLFCAANNLIQALDPQTGVQLWQDTSIGGIHWESPVVANGMLYSTDESGQLTAFAPAPTATPTPSATVTPTPRATATATSTHTPKPTNTSTPARPTSTVTAMPSSTGTPRPTGTRTPVVPTATHTPKPTDTNTPGGPTNTSTPLGPTATHTPKPTNTSTPGGPTSTATSTPSRTATPKPTGTNTPVGPTATHTPRPTTTSTPAGPTSTVTAMPSSTATARPTSTSTPVGPTATHTPKPTTTSTLQPTSTVTSTPAP
jgi:outer membrane protein assembly factor BamB